LDADYANIQGTGLFGSLENQIFRNQEFITKRGNLKNTKKKELTTRSLLSLEAQRAQRIAHRMNRIFLNLD